MELNPLKFITKTTKVKEDDKKLNKTFVVVVIVLMILFAIILSIKG